MIQKNTAPSESCSVDIKYSNERKEMTLTETLIKEGSVTSVMVRVIQGQGFRVRLQSMLYFIISFLSFSAYLGSTQGMKSWPDFKNKLKWLEQFNAVLFPYNTVIISNMCLFFLTNSETTEQILKWIALMKNNN